MAFRAAPVQRIGLALLLFALLFRPTSAGPPLVAWAVAVVGLAIVVLAWFGARAASAQERRLANGETE